MVIKMRKFISGLVCFTVIAAAASAHAESDFRDIKAKQGENGKYAFFEQGKQLTEYVYDEVLEDFASVYTWSYKGETPHGNPTTFMRGIRYAQNYAEVRQYGATYKIGYDFSEFKEMPRKISYSQYRQNGKFREYIDYELSRTICIYNTETQRFIFVRDVYDDSDVSAIRGNYIIVYSHNNKKYGVIDADGKWVLDLEYDSLKFNKDGDGSIVIDQDNTVIDLNTIRYEQLPVYYTSEKVTINGFEIPCYESDGKVMVKAEDLGCYGFDVVWNEDDARLWITRNPDYYLINPVEMPPEGKEGKIYTYTQNSDIQVYINGSWIKSYSIDGRMLIDLHDIHIDDWHSDTQNTNSFTLTGAEIESASL